MSGFVYPPFSPNTDSIRLIRLLRGPKRDPENPYGTVGIECFFELTFLSGSKKFDAVSYAWGYRPKMDRVITVSGRPLMVSKHVEDTLFGLRQVDKDRLLWIDVISIDQENPDERGRQVDRMGDIYRQAETVIAILEPAGKRQRIDYLDPLIDGLSVSEGPSTRSWAALRLIKSAWSGINGAISLRLSHYDETCLLHLLERPWFKRVWVVQEVAAARKLLFVCGDETIDGKYFVRLHQRFLSRVRGAELRYKFNELEPFLSLISADLTSGPKPELLRLLQTFRSWGALDSRDKIYVLRNLSADGRQAMKLAPEQKYKISVPLLYQQVARYMMRRYGSLGILTYASRVPQSTLIDPATKGWIPWLWKQFVGDDQANNEPQIPEYPSWCPDWRRADIQSLQPDTNMRTVINSTPLDLLDAPTIESERSGPVLNVEGIHLGDVSSVFDGSVEAVPHSSIAKDRYLTWPHEAISDHLALLNRSLIDQAKANLKADAEERHEREFVKRVGKYQRESAKRVREYRTYPTSSRQLSPTYRRPPRRGLLLDHEVPNPVSEDGLMIGDQIWALKGSSGIAVLRNFRNTEMYVLVVLEHSRYPQLDFANEYASRTTWGGACKGDMVFGNVLSRLITRTSRADLQNMIVDVDLV